MTKNLTIKLLFNAVLISFVFFLYSCANMGVTEPVLSGSPAPPAGSSYNLSGESRFGSFPEQGSRAASVPAYDDSAVLRELAALRGDLRILQEDNQKMSFKIEGMERELLAKDAQLKEMQSLLSVLDGQVSSADKQWSDRMEMLKRNMDAEREQRRKELSSLSTSVAQEISKVESKVVAPISSGRYQEITIQKGDTLSTIAVASGCTVAQLKQLNGLKNDRIIIGQTLKVPAK